MTRDSGGLQFRSKTVVAATIITEMSIIMTRIICVQERKRVRENCTIKNRISKRKKNTQYRYLQRSTGVVNIVDERTYTFEWNKEEKHSCNKEYLVGVSIMQHH